MLGDVGVGKTSLIQRMKTDEFEENVQPTIGFEFTKYGLLINESDRVLLYVWDTTG